MSYCKYCRSKNAYNLVKQNYCLIVVIDYQTYYRVSAVSKIWRSHCFAHVWFASCAGDRLVIRALHSNVRQLTPFEPYLAILLYINRVLVFLTANHLTDRVAKRFAESLRENRTLWHLDLSHNEIGEQGAVFLGAGLVGIKKTRLWKEIDSIHFWELESFSKCLILGISGSKSPSWIYFKNSLSTSVLQIFE